MKLLNNIQQELVVNKTRQGPNYKYHNAEDVLKAVKPLLGDGVILLSDEIVAVGQFNYIKTTASIKDGSGDVVSVTGWSKEPLEMMRGMDPCKISGCASSYARKYALNGLFGINDEPDADEAQQAYGGQSGSQPNNNNNDDFIF